MHSIQRLKEQAVFTWKSYGVYGCPTAFFPAITTQGPEAISASSSAVATYPEQEGEFWWCKNTGLPAWEATWLFQSCS